jgi:hypothetical protein
MTNDREHEIEIHPTNDRGQIKLEDEHPSGPARLTGISVPGHNLPGEGWI